MLAFQQYKTGLIFQIQRFSLDDGPGIRTTVFLKGCTLRCAWCHNPESIHPNAELSFQPQLCIRCGACVTFCPHSAHVCNEQERYLDRAACDGCMKCATVCPTGALSVFGQEMTAEEVVGLLLRDRPFYLRSGGGVTFSGGEPLRQGDFLLEMLKLCWENKLHTAVDTAGSVPYEAFLSVLPYTDLFLYDIKAVGPELHRRFTGAGNARIQENLKRLADHGARVWVRVPYIPGFNDSEEEIAAIAAFLRNIPAVEKVELLPYHTYGEAKYDYLGIRREGAERRAPGRAELLHILEAYQAGGLRVECPAV
jgi:pyruvate formate lyase activating enzyme